MPGDSTRETAPADFDGLVAALEGVLAPLLDPDDTSDDGLAKLGAAVDVRSLLGGLNEQRGRHKGLIERDKAPPIAALRQLLSRVSLDGRMFHVAVRSGNKTLYMLLEGLRGWIDDLEFDRELDLHKRSPGAPGCSCAVSRRLGRREPTPSELELVDEEPTEREGIKLLHYRCPRCETEWRFKFVEDAFDGKPL